MIRLYGLSLGHLLWAVRPSILSAALPAQYVLDGAARIGATLFGELLNAVFANVGQRAIRKVARETFDHLLNLDLRFHLSRQTGGLTRAIDRGTKYVVKASLTQQSYHDKLGELPSFFRLSSSVLFPLHLKSPWSAAYWYVQQWHNDWCNS